MGQPPLKVRESEVSLEAVRSTGAGGQNVNKVSSAIHLRFDITASSLPEGVKLRLLALKDRRITRDGVLVIKAWQHRSQDMNRADALARLERLINSVAEPPRRRIPTRPSGSSKLRRIESKIRRGRLKALRGKVELG